MPSAPRTPRPDSPTRVERLQELFHATLEQPPERRADFVRARAPDDSAMQQEVLALVAADEAGRDRFVSPVSHAAIREAGAPDRWIGARLGAYEVRRRIGAGGMGTVYEAARADDEYQRRVAVKLLRRGLDSELAVRRFRNERQILANLTHPNIAALLDGGTTADGQPYIVMEYVDGEPITRWCAERRLPVRERVALLAQVCAAVEYAHRNRVVHRDLKPGNILVTEDGTVKLLDFGVAKLLDDADAGAADPTVTHLGQRAFTPEYAAPEQFREQRVGTAADVYALGVVLFELLTGRRPFEVEGRSFAEFERIVCNADPPRPSAHVGDGHWRALRERSAAQARDRTAGDLDAIVGMALRKEPERRYRSAAQLGQDLQDHVAHRPIAARPESSARRLRRWVLRHRLEVGVGLLALVLMLGGAATAALAAVSVLGGIVATGWQARRAQAEARLAEQAANAAEVERAKAERVRDFLRSILGASHGFWFGPQPGARPDITVAEVLDRATETVGEQLVGQPEIESEIRRTLGMSYVSLGRFDRAVEQLEEAIAIDRVQHTGPRREFAEGLHFLGIARWFRADYPQAAEALRAAIVEMERAGATEERMYGAACNDLGITLHRMGDVENARTHLLRANEQSRAHLGEAHPVVAVSHGNLGMVAFDLGDLEEAERHHRLATEVFQRLDAANLAEHAIARSNLAQVLAYRGMIGQAEELLDDADEMLRRSVGDEHHAFQTPTYLRALIRYYQVRYEEAAALVDRFLEIATRHHPPEHPRVILAGSVLGSILNATGRAEAAEPHLRSALDLIRGSLPVGNWRVGIAAAALGRSLQLQGRLAEAEPLLREGYEGLERAGLLSLLPGPETAAWMAELYDALGDGERAAEVRRRSVSA